MDLIDWTHNHGGLLSPRENPDSVPQGRLSQTCPNQFFLPRFMGHDRTSSCRDRDGEVRLLAERESAAPTALVILHPYTQPFRAGLYLAGRPSGP